MTVYSDYTDLQQAVNATPPGDILQLPSFAISASTPVSITRNIHILGTSKDNSLVSVPPGQDGLVVSGNAQVTFSDFGLIGTYQTNGGALMRVSSTGGNSIFRNLTFDFGYDGLVIENGSTHLVDGCWFQQYMHNGVVINDSTDSSISSCSLDSGQPNATGVLYKGRWGGLRIINSKILGGEIGVMVDFAANMADGDFLITGCSIEVPSYGVFITSQPGAKFGNVLLTGNEISGGQYSVMSFPNASGKWLSNVLLTGNLLQGKVSMEGIISGYSNSGNVFV